MPDEDTIPAEPSLAVAVHRRVLGNHAFMLLWSGQVVSGVGDALFNLAVLWIVYTQSNSALQTAVISVVWHVSSSLIGPLAGTLADRWDRKRILVTVNLLSALVVGAVAAEFPIGNRFSPLVIFVAIFLLNSLGTFTGPARASLLPELVGADLLATAAGWLSIAGQGASFVGNAVAGIIIAAVGAVWAVLGDALSFLVAALCLTLAALPARHSRRASVMGSEPSAQHRSLLAELVDGWRVMVDQPVIRVLVWLSVLVNVASFMGPLMPALVRRQLQGGAGTYGSVEAVSIVGALVGAASAGTLERRLGAGHLTIAGWGVAGVCALGMAISTSAPLTAALEAIMACSLTTGDVATSALMPALIPEEYRGRVYGIMHGLAVLAIPASALLAGWLADKLGPAPLFALAGVWVLGAAGLATANPHFRTARIQQFRVR